MKEFFSFMMGAMFGAAVMLGASELSKNKDAILSVSNSCELINKEDLNKIFDRFYRLDEARTRQKGGNGMGLSIAKAIVDKHNAKISAETDDDNNFIMKVKFYRKK